VRDVSFLTGVEVVQANYVMALVDQPLAKVRS